MADDWQPGDLALCVCPDPLGYDESRSGGVYSVISVEAPSRNWDGTISTGLQFKDCRRLRGYPFSDARRFRKIRPHTPDAEDAETIRLLSGAPVREPVA